MNDHTVMLPPGPRCARCGHMPCPCCLDWCDTIIERYPLSHTLDEEVMCCGGKCDFTEADVERWCASWQTPELDTFGLNLIVAEGPWQAEP